MQSAMRSALQSNSQECDIDFSTRGGVKPADFFESISSRRPDQTVVCTGSARSVRGLIHGSGYVMAARVCSGRVRTFLGA